MATATVLKVAKEALVAMLLEMNFSTANKWNDKRLLDKVAELPEFDGIEDVKLKDKANSKLLGSILETLKDEGEIELELDGADDEEEGDEEESPKAKAAKKPAKKAGKKKAVAEDDDEDEEEESDDDESDDDEDEEEESDDDESDDDEDEEEEASSKKKAGKKKPAAAKAGKAKKKNFPDGEKSVAEEMAENKKKAKGKKGGKGKEKSEAARGSDKGLSITDAAAKVLVAKGKPMRAQEMIEAMAKKNLWTSPGGATPHATLYAAILREMGLKGKKARFAKVDRGLFEATKYASAKEE